MITTSRFPVTPPFAPLATAAEVAEIVFVPAPNQVFKVAVCVTVTTLAPFPGQGIADVGLLARRLHTQEVATVAVTD
jgi:hypothetical protein